MKKILTLFLLLLLAAQASAQASLNSFFTDTDVFLQKYVENGLVDYPKVKENFEEIEALYGQVATMNLSAGSEQERKAFYLNAYNLIVIYQVSKYYPLKSALDRSGFFDKVKHQVAGESMTLNGLEIGIIIREFKDPRIHFALACAAKGCPPLAEYAFVPAKLDQQLNKRTVKALNNDYFIRVSPKQQKAGISKIFDWYEKDFTRTGMTVREYINQYRREDIPQNYEIGYYEYDWSLNIKGTGM